MSFEVVIPALAFRTAENELDLGLTRAYAERAAGTWADRFILSGSTVLGDLLAPTERALILDMWSEVMERSRLVACCWCREDIEQAGQRKILPLVVMRDLHDRAQACSFFAELPEGAFVYSNPKFTPTALDPALAVDAEQRGLLPAGAKISKLAVGDIGRIRSSIASRDLPVILGVVMFTTTTILFLNLLVDLVYVLIDPRIHTSEYAAPAGGRLRLRRRAAAPVAAGSAASAN